MTLPVIRAKTSILNIKPNHAPTSHSKATATMELAATTYTSARSSPKQNQKNTTIAATPKKLTVPGPLALTPTTNSGLK